MRSVIAVALAISLSLPSLLHADPRPRDGGTLVADDCALARKAGKTCVLDVPPEEVGGKVPTADGIAVGTLTFGKPTSLIRLRHHFLPEIVKSAEDL